MSKNLTSKLNNILNGVKGVLSNHEEEVLTELFASELTKLEILEKCKHPAGYCKYINNDLEIVYSNNVLKLISNNIILSLENSPLSKIVLNSKVLTDIVFEAFNNGILISFDFKSSFISVNRIQPFKFKLVPIPNIGMIFFFDNATENVLEKNLFSDETMKNILNKFYKVNVNELRSDIEYFGKNYSLNITTSFIAFKKHGTSISKSNIIFFNEFSFNNHEFDNLKEVLSSENQFKKILNTKFFNFDIEKGPQSLISSELKISIEFTIIIGFLIEDEGKKLPEIKDLSIFEHVFTTLRSFIEQEKELLSSVSHYIISDLIPIFKTSHINYIILNDNQQVVDYNLPEEYSKLIDQNNQLSSFSNIKEINFFILIIECMLENKISNVCISTNVFSNNINNYSLINYKKVLNFNNYLLVVFDSLNKNIQKSEGKHVENEKLEELNLLPENLSLNQIQKKIERYQPGFINLFDKYTRHNHYIDLRIFHEEILRLLEKRQFDTSHLIKFYLALTLSLPFFQLSRKDLLFLLVETNILSYSIFSKIYPSIPQENEEYFIFNKGGNIILNDLMREILIELLLHSIGLLSEVSIYVKTNDIMIDLDYDIVFDVQNFINDDQLSSSKKIVLISEKLVKIDDILRRYSTNPHEKTLTIISKDLPWYIGFTIGFRLRPFKISVVQIDKMAQNFFTNVSFEDKNELFFIEQVFTEEESTELIIILNFVSIISPKVKNYLEKNKIQAPILNYYLKDQFDFKNHFAESKFNNIIIEDIKRRIFETEFHLPIEKVRIFCDINFSLGLLLGNAEFLRLGETFFYYYNQKNTNFNLITK